MQATLPASLPSLKDISLLVVGDVMLDRYWFGETTRISPEAPVPIVKMNQQHDRPGGAANVALNLAALGANVTLLGCIGQDEAGNQLIELLNASGVSHDLISAPSLKTIVKLRVMGRGQQLIRLDFEETIPAEHQANLAALFKKHLNQHQLVIFSDYGKGTLSGIASLIQLAKKQPCQTVIDPKGTDFTKYQHADIITPNFAEFEAVVGVANSEEIIVQKARDLIKKNHLTSLLITRSEAGMTLITEEQATHFPAYAKEIVDVTGAGDTVVATLGAMLAASIPLPEAAALSNLAASLTVSKLGAATVSAPELSFALHHKKEDAHGGILNESQLVQAMKTARNTGKKIVFTNGCYDILHAGHVRSLQLAKSYGDLLIVAVNDDASIRELKGNNRPINTLAHRMQVLAGLQAVDWVVPFSDPTPERLLHLLQPDILVKGGDYTLDQVVGADIVRAYGGEVRIAQHDITQSSTQILNQMTQTEEG